MADGEQAAPRCCSCGNDLRATARFCDACGTATVDNSLPGEHKQVTVLFADVVGSMKLARDLDPERLQAIMNELFNRSAAVIRRYGGTVDKFTGDGLMALFGAPRALEDHALRACVAALEIQTVSTDFAGHLRATDGIELRLRVGLNSGEVIAGEIGSGPGRYTAVGHSVGMAQRMEAAAPAGGVLCSLTTARLVEDIAELGEPSPVAVKGAEHPVAARQLLAVDSGRIIAGRTEGPLLGRDDELHLLSEIYLADPACRVGVVGAAGLGKSRMVRELERFAHSRGDEVVVARCEAHTTFVAFRMLTRLLRSVFGVDGLDHRRARERVAQRLGWPDTSALRARILFDVMAIADPDAPLPEESVDGRRAQIVAILLDALRTSHVRTLVVIEDVHWIDSPSDEILAEFFAAAADESGFCTVSTCRPEFAGASRSQWSHTIALTALPRATTVAFARQILGPRPGLTRLTDRIADTAAGNPFFVEEIVRDLADRGVLHGDRGGYRLAVDADRILVPPTVHAALGSRIDRLPQHAKATLNAAAVIGMHFDSATVQTLVPHDADEALHALLAAELIDRTEHLPVPRYCFHHPLVRMVAYESQLRSTRASTHIRLAEALQARQSPTDESAGLIAAHLEAAGAYRDAYAWHMRAAQWLRPRDLPAAREQWRQAAAIAEPSPPAMRIAALAMLTSTTLYVGADDDSDTVYGELYRLATAAGDLVPLALGMAGRVFSLIVNDARTFDAVPLADELNTLQAGLECDPTTRSIVLNAIAFAYAVGCRFGDALSVLDVLIDHTADAPDVERVPALALRAFIGVIVGDSRSSLRELRSILEGARTQAPIVQASLLEYPALLAILGLHCATETLDTAHRDLGEMERTGDRFGILMVQWVLGSIMLRADPSAHEQATALLRTTAAEITGRRRCRAMLITIRVDLALDRAEHGDLDGAITDVRQMHRLCSRGFPLLAGVSAEALVRLLLRRGRPEDIREARTVLDLWRRTHRGCPRLARWASRYEVGGSSDAAVQLSGRV